MRRGFLDKILHHLRPHKNPDSVNPKDRSKRDVDQVEKTEDDNKNARPFLSIEKPDPSDEAGNRQEQDESTHQCRYQSSNGDRSLIP